MFVLSVPYKDLRFDLNVTQDFKCGLFNVLLKRLWFLTNAVIICYVKVPVASEIIASHNFVVSGFVQCC